MRRFVFVLSSTGDDVLEGRNVEIRARSLADALDRVDGWLVTRGFVTKLIGERRGYLSSRVFHPLVALEELPRDILQNERFIGTTIDPILGSVDAEAARLLLLAKRGIEAEARGFGLWAEAG